MFHRSERLLLRPAFAEDWRELHEAIGDEAIVRLPAGAPWPCHEEDRRASAGRVLDRAFPRLLVTLPGSWGSRIIGGIGIEPGEEGARLECWIARPFRGRGFATEAGRAVKGIARMLGHRRLFAGHMADNPASLSVLSKLGFQPAGEICTRFSPDRGGEIRVATYVCDLAAASADPAPPAMPRAA